MRKTIRMFVAILLSISILSGCSKSERIFEGREAQVSEGLKGLEADLARNLKDLVKAVDDGDIEAFLSFQDGDNKVFFKEQKRWIETVVYKREKGFKYDLSLDNIRLDSADRGSMDFIVRVEDPLGKKYNNRVTYLLINKGSWKISDMPYSSLRDGNITVNYLEGQREMAEKQLQNIKAILELYKSTFKWSPNNITVKLYKSSEEMAATIPWTTLAGWNEAGESIKVLGVSGKDDTLLYLAHEIAHNMLSDLTNDNASLYIHEGFATLLEYSITRNKDGKLMLDYSKSDGFAQSAIKAVKEKFISIEEMNKLTYEQGYEIYFYGFLLTKYLVEERGLKQYITMSESLRKYPYRDERSEQKVELTNRYSVEALKSCFGAIDKLSEEYSNYYK